MGHQISNKGVEMVPSYIEAILAWPKPTSAKELATFLGKCGYYRSFIKDYSKVSACLEAEKKKTDIEWKWSDKMNEAFKILKNKFKDKPILAYPEFGTGKEFILDIDWSKEGMGQCLSQEQTKEDGKRE